MLAGIGLNLAIHGPDTILDIGEITSNSSINARMVGVRSFSACAGCCQVTSELSICDRVLSIFDKSFVHRDASGKQICSLKRVHPSAVSFFVPERIAARFDGEIVLRSLPVIMPPALVHDADLQHSVASRH
ncbi:hypothetical protein D2T29_03650 [Sinirhodobacter populi]|uniref:Uncharacterized protein n=1 Tax=Paenirhodobacter populi TaxID=2306993 RepID=A0A443KP40_9RHOB|nr:hypothetical protein [Sinirhodobacter populi]RWR34650.1 hypothetical protein D2T29_03650 [Sinirhodobacter populi]